tara:strand:+ start:3308 stop:4060 length:753 start_codon:yes stop_codon:yes gene_type:complete
MAREFGDDLAVIFVECQGASREGTERFAWNQKWMGTGAMWTSERPFDTGAKGIPNFALLSSTGEVLLMGNPNAMHGAIKDAIESEIKGAQSAPEDAPKSLKKAWKSFAKGDFGKAIDEARKVESRGDEDAGQATATATAFLANIETKFARVDWLLENAYLVEAQDLFKDLAKSCKNVDDLEERIAGLEKTFDADGFDDELEAAEAFAKLEQKLSEEGFDEKLLRKLEKFVEKNGSARVGKRAQHLLSLSS